MQPVIRPARPDDALAIASIYAEAWEGRVPDPERIARLIGEGEHGTQVAAVRDVPVGFVDGFVTRDRDRRSRWEVDLLVVAPEYRRMGVAARLLEATLIAGRVRRAAFARALVAIGNTAAESSFSRAGFRPQPDALRLVVSAVELLGDPEPPPGLHLVPVRTFGYRGFWLENEHTLAAFHAGQRVRMVFDADLAGALVPRANRAALDAADAAGYETVGDYRWWHAPPG